MKEGAEKMKRFFSEISLLCSAGFPAGKKGGDLIGTAETGHWGGEREDGIKIWMRLGFYGKERGVKEILEQSHRKCHETRNQPRFPETSGQIIYIDALSAVL